MDEKRFPNTDLHLMENVDCRDVIDIESMTGQAFREGILLPLVSQCSPQTRQGPPTFEGTNEVGFNRPSTLSESTA